MAEGNVPQREQDKSGRPAPAAVNGQLIKNVMAILERRNIRAMALAMSLTSQLEPKDLSNPSDSENAIAWALAELLEGELTSVADLHCVRGMLESAHV